MELYKAVFMEKQANIENLTPFKKRIKKVNLHGVKW